MKNNFRCLLLAITVTFISSCEKDPGEGGNSSIKGNVSLTVIDRITSDTISSHAGFDTDVYIIYGSDIHYGDRTRTNYDGKFEFKYLRKGEYRIYTYSDGNNPFNPYNADSTVIKSLEITDKKQTIDAGTFAIKKYR